LKRTKIIITTIAVETIILYLISLLFDWSFLEIIFLGGLAIFGCIWLFQLNMNQSNNQYNAHIKGWTGQNSGEIKPFQYKLSPVSLGLLIFLVGSFFITLIKYYPYFIN